MNLEIQSLNTGVSFSRNKRFTYTLICYLRKTDHRADFSFIIVTRGYRYDEIIWASSVIISGNRQTVAIVDDDKRS